MMLSICTLFTSSTFWTAASAIATAVMAWFTYATIQNSKEQVETMKRQWEKENRPFLEILPVFVPFSRRGANLALEIRNIGNKSAYDIKISIEKKFRDGFPVESIKNRIDTICQESYRILPGASKTLPISAIQPGSGNKHMLFYKPISDSDFEALDEYLDNFSFKVTCAYNRDQFEQIIKKEDQELQHFDNLNFLEEIEHDLSSMKDSLQNIGSDISTIAYKMEN